MLTEDTIHTAYERAKNAQRCGIFSVDVLCDALNRTQRQIVEPFPGCCGIVVQRYCDEDGIAVLLRVRVDVADILIEAHNDYVRSIETPTQPKYDRRKKPSNVMRR